MGVLAGEWSNYFHLSDGVAVIQWITSCHKNRMTTRVITLWCVDNVLGKNTFSSGNIVKFEGDKIYF